MKVNIKLKAECLLGWIQERQIVQRKQKDEGEIKKAIGNLQANFRKPNRNRV